MTQWQGQTGFINLQDDLLTELVTAIEAGPGGELGRKCIVPGMIAWDECDCGLLALSLQRWFLSSTFPTRGRSSDPPVGDCQPSQVVGELFINLMRCAPQPPEGDFAPSCSQLDEATRLLMREAHIVLVTTICRLQELKDDDFVLDFMVNDQTTPGPAGGCVGSLLHVSVSLDLVR